jgi:hypothetical protein
LDAGELTGDRTALGLRTPTMRGVDDGPLERPPDKRPWPVSSVYAGEPYTGPDGAPTRALQQVAQAR